MSLDIDTAVASMDVSSSMLMFDTDSTRASAPAASLMDRKLAADKSVRGVLGVAVIRFVDTGTTTPPESAQL